jgi:hypothetical protein
LAATIIRGALLKERLAVKGIHSSSSDGRDDLSVGCVFCVEDVLVMGNTA